MTEEEWLECNNVRLMLERVGTRASDRKLRFFACAIFRQTRVAQGDSVDVTAWDMTERFVDGRIDWREVQKVWWKTGSTNPLNRVLSLMDADRLTWSVESLARAVASAAESLQQSQARSEAESAEHRTKQTALIRHIFDNPFRPYQSPPSWPSTVVQLAESLYAGQDCAFALHDALLEAGHAELAEHFREEKSHPKGCWVVDVILGKK
jgi:hypothetical protein